MSKAILLLLVFGVACTETLSLEDVDPFKAKGGTVFIGVPVNKADVECTFTLRTPENFAAWTGRGKYKTRVTEDSNPSWPYLILPELGQIQGNRMSIADSAPEFFFEMWLKYRTLDGKTLDAEFTLMKCRLPPST